MECLRHNFTIGIVLGGRYETISPLNHGSFGMVFMARDIKTGKTVAIKCLTKRAAANDAGFDLAIDDKSEELVLHRRLAHHPNVVNLLDSFETDAHVYLVLEFCEQGDLYEAIRMGHGPLETEHVRRFMLELVDAVAYMHSKGVYHRDIKPENVFLSQSGSMKLGDFGLATTEHWTFETAVGSDRYMSPEQYDSDGAGYSPAQADIWAIGICLLNILFARNPFNTPSEDDKFFLDFSRDKQSLFDVFPSMSQDTYEVIVQCMNLDPNKRSLVGARRALQRVVSFTTSDESLDDFCSADAVVVASTNREPLRTPSIQSPHVDNGAFPWAQALQASTLSAIPDEEAWSEDLFSKSVTTADWMSADAQTPSMSSVLDANFASSMQSLNIGQLRIPAKNPAKISPMAGSLPISMTKPRLQSAMSMVFGRKETVSKSWSDMWDEDVEEQEHTRQLEALKEMNSRTWSHDSTAAVDKTSDDTPRAGLSPATKSATMSTEQDIPSIDSTLAAGNIDEDLGADGFFFQEALPLQELPQPAARYSPPPKRSNVDKWAALGERRRAYTGTSSAKATGVTIKALSSSSGNRFDLMGLFDTSPPKNTSYSFFNFNQTPPNQPSTIAPNNKWNHTTPVKERAKECPRSKGRDRDWNWNFDWRKEKRHAFGTDVEWVGGWQEAHS
ncbi:kinase-like protein [Thozetella sp. PMI_491]|nr:kinase-like protein [Thozetella sp. PMI_491]